MFEMADIHAHILGGVDDGAKNSDEMKEMLDMAYNDGIRHICFTPHFKIYHFRNEGEINAYNSKIEESFDKAVEYAKEKYPDLNLYRGNEVMYHSGVIDSSDSNLCKRIRQCDFFCKAFRIFE